MPEALPQGQASNKPFPVLAKPFSPEDESALREALKRCSPSTFEAAVQFRKTGNPEHVPAVVIGVIERFVEPDLRTKLKDADDDLRLIEDLGIDSLTMMEIVILVEDVLQLSINNDELRNLRTVGDVKTFIDCKIRDLPLPKPTKFLPIEHIGAVMPIQPPFLFLNEASVSSTGANGKYKITGQEFFLQGHFKDNPVMPASIMLEALGQLAVLFLLEGLNLEPGKVVSPNTIFFTGCEGVRAHRMCKPGDILTLSIKPKRMKMPLATFEGAIRVGQEKAAIAEEITLTFGFADALVKPEPEPAVAATPSEKPRSAESGDTPPLQAALGA
ncbi:phosphopantetheine-binding protein [Opitutus terrae]|uniref:Beta-hydroxyacyl-(Acyl-carrier-protein) dehydratase FabA/FabZ n=1 Tax=Opitutus terrae (strain DSM 11246 / JCM 15787 / PB90-1) TaxID=452637 RepID=B1ZZV7_OPITP|nr:phosphopantetheine-binding protein [Opitutus terrae]ACB77290.1 Beta-hydroxyacyl-(acyl-carrier-protein) dehydratase FabA/FabZ [Opitutus terrae PB90-1]